MSYWIKDKTPAEVTRETGEAFDYVLALYPPAFIELASSGWWRRSIESITSVLWGPKPPIVYGLRIASARDITRPALDAGTEWMRVQTALNILDRVSASPSASPATAGFLLARAKVLADVRKDINRVIVDVGAVANRLAEEERAMTERAGETNIG